MNSVAQLSCHGRRLGHSYARVTDHKAFMHTTDRLPIGPHSGCDSRLRLSGGAEEVRTPDLRIANTLHLYSGSFYNGLYRLDSNMLQVTTVSYGFYNIPYKSMHVYTGITHICPPGSAPFTLSSIAPHHIMHRRGVGSGTGLNVLRQQVTHRARRARRPLRASPSRRGPPRSSRALRA